MICPDYRLSYDVNATSLKKVNREQAGGKIWPRNGNSGIQNDRYDKLHSKSRFYQIRAVQA